MPPVWAFERGADVVGEEMGGGPPAPGQGGPDNADPDRRPTLRSDRAHELIIALLTIWIEKVDKRGTIVLTGSFALGASR